MPWARLDDRFHVNPKVVGLSIEAVGLYVLALSYCADQLTDGRVPGGWAKTLGGSRAKRIIGELVDHDLWQAVEGDWLVHDYLDFNPPREQVLRERSELSAKRAAAGRRGAEATNAKRTALA